LPAAGKQAGSGRKNIPRRPASSAAPPGYKPLPGNLAAHSVPRAVEIIDSASGRTYKATIGSTRGGWYDDFRERGYDAIRETAEFDRIWVGTEIRRKIMTPSFHQRHARRMA
jgi:hypothetical protein